MSNAKRTLTRSHVEAIRNMAFKGVDGIPLEKCSVHRLPSLDVIALCDMALAAMTNTSGADTGERSATPTLDEQIAQAERDYDLLDSLEGAEHPEHDATRLATQRAILASLRDLTAARQRIEGLEVELAALNRGVIMNPDEPVELLFTANNIYVNTNVVDPSGESKMLVALKIKPEQVENILNAIRQSKEWP